MATQDKTDQLRMLGQGFARMAAQVEGMQGDIAEMRAGVARLLEGVGEGEVRSATCATRQDGRWEAHEQAHEKLDEDVEELERGVRQIGENVRIVSASVSRIADRQRQG